MTNLLRKISNYLQRNKYKKVLGRCDNNVNISRQAIIHNPQCIYIDKNVGIGDGVYLGPVIEYADIPYNPKIIIGEGTWIGNHCSLAAINKINFVYLQLIIPQYFISNKSGIWSLSLIVHSKG